MCIYGKIDVAYKVWNIARMLPEYIGRERYDLERKYRTEEEIGTEYSLKQTAISTISILTALAQAAALPRRLHDPVHGHRLQGGQRGRRDLLRTRERLWRGGNDFIQGTLPFCLVHDIAV